MSLRSLPPWCFCIALSISLAIQAAAHAQALPVGTLAPGVSAEVIAARRLLPRANPSALALALAPVPRDEAAGAIVAPEGPAERWVDARRVDRLESSLVELAHADQMVRTWGAGGALVLGGLLIAGGVLVGLDDDWGGRGRVAVSAGAWAAGVGLIATGIYRFFTPTPAEERLFRWSGLRQEHKLDIFEFARIEGELQSEAAMARFGRRLAAYSSFGLIAAGGGLMGLAASSELDGSAEKDAYILGGALLGVGALQSVALFLVRTPAERAWKHYAQGGGGFFSQIERAPRLAWRD
jgi:hypothetical protein